MPRTILVEGDLVRILDTTVVREVRLPDLMGQIENRPPLTIGMLPKSAVLLHWNESDPRAKYAQFLCEMTPGVRTARYLDRRYQISLPWTYFLFDFETAGNPMDRHTMWTPINHRIFWAREQVTGMDSQLATALIPNCATDGRICYGTTAVDANLPLGVRIDRLVNEFYRTTFTHDSGTGSPWTDETGSNTWRRWDIETRRNHLAWQEFPEWTNGSNRIRTQPLRDILGERIDRFTPIQLEGVIPELTEPITFGRAEEWLLGVSPVNRHRLMTALQNMQADDAAAVEAPAAPVFDGDADELGGEVIRDA